MTDRPEDEPRSPADRAVDPATPQVDLQHLAADHPEVRPLIAENPQAYPELLAWLGSLADPAVDAALIRRARSTPRSYVEAPTAVHQPVEDDTGRISGVGLAAGHGGHGAPTSGWADPYAPRGSATRAGSAAVMDAAPATDNDHFFAERSDRGRRRRGGLGIVLVMLLILLGGGTAATYTLYDGEFGSFGSFGGEGSGQPDAEAEAPEGDLPGSGSAEDDDDSDDENDEAEPARPAPADAVELTSFSAPSGNIHCEVSDDDLLCSIDEFLFDPPEGCFEAVTLRITADGSVSPACDDVVGPQPSVLDYALTAADDQFACEAGYEGFECWNTQTGASFFLSRESYSVEE